MVLRNASTLACQEYDLISYRILRKRGTSSGIPGCPILIDDIHDAQPFQVQVGSHFSRRGTTLPSLSGFEGTRFAVPKVDFQGDGSHGNKNREYIMVYQLLRT